MSRKIPRRALRCLAALAGALLVLWIVPAALATQEPSPSPTPSPSPAPSPEPAPSPAGLPAASAQAAAAPAAPGEEPPPRIIRTVCTDKVCGGCDGKCRKSSGHVAIDKKGHCSCTPTEGSALDRAIRQAYEKHPPQ